MQCLLGLVCPKHLFFNEKQKCCTFTRDLLKDTPIRKKEKKKKKAGGIRARNLNLGRLVLFLLCYNHGILS